MLEQAQRTTELTEISTTQGDGNSRLLDSAWYALELESERLMRKMRQQERALLDQDATGHDPGDQSERLVRRSKGIALWRLWEKMLQEVERAMVRIENGTYGVCEHCGLPIPVDRLDALPSAALCVDCAALQTKNVWAV